MLSYSRVMLAARPVHKDQSVDEASSPFQIIQRYHSKKGFPPFALMEVIANIDFTANPMIRLWLQFLQSTPVG